ncbi:2Fe-2S iron-sulfur cluster-binding protein [uncultured Agrococcus sp.]|uniref:2Fe-2S iron-sulfur cluster-binding protein n=1 Tax=uncultured Agrococcus sp. TaxID=382258 RepID=UPI0025E2E383|nr:2Fe-2S iron-sulfur cluster-binding protein [uncultured Agrococcus sp.]
MSRRLAQGGLINRARPLRFVVDGQEYTGFEGDTLASAMLGAGVQRVGDSIRHGRPRGIFGARWEEPNAMVRLLAPLREPMVPATVVDLVDGLEAVTLSGRGVLAPSPRDRRDAVHAHAETLVIGAGQAGLAAAERAAGAGQRVILVDDRATPGGAIPSPDAADRVAALAGREHVTVLPRTAVIGLYDDGYAIAIERRDTGHAGAEVRRVWRIRAASIVIATGTIDRPYAFDNNDLPGIMLLGAAHEYLARAAVLVADAPVISTAHDGSYETVDALARAGARLPAVVDARDEVSSDARSVCDRHSIPLKLGTVITSAHGDRRVEAVSTSDGDRLPCDGVLLSAARAPQAALASHVGIPLAYERAVAALVPDGETDRVRVIGSAAGEGLPEAAELWCAPDAEHAYVDLSRDSTVADIDVALDAGLRSVEHIKRFTTIGTGPDQGRTSGLLAAGIVAERLGRPVGDVGVPRSRPPVIPVSFADLAGRRTGDLADPVRRTALHSRHVERGAIFEDVGQWKRPRYFPRGGEAMGEAVRRECIAARTDVAMMDASTLGIIEVTGPDAGPFLDRMYTNRLSTLGIGRVRYTMMCGLDGMVTDDGTVMCIDDEHFRVSTTTGGAAAVLDAMELWLQTEWPELRVHLTSTTDHWATIALVGPRSRDVLQTLTPDTDLSAAAFEFMRWRRAQVAGIDAVVSRVSFSGELAFEIHVPWWAAARVWDALAEHDVTPYGTETMHVLRAEKGFVIVGQDTDGTVTPIDLGYGWIVSNKKGDFIGKRSLARPDTRRPDRPQLVGLLTEPPALLDEGAALVDADGSLLGHVTSSYDSAAVGRPIALALVRGGHARMGATVTAPTDGVSCRIVDPVFYDPEGRRRDG